MPKRTIASAKEELGHLVMAPDTKRQLEREIHKAREKGLAMVNKTQSERFSQLEEGIRETKREFSSIETALYELKRDSERSEISAAEYRLRFDDLMERRAMAEARSRSLDQRIEEYQRVEADPEGWLDDFFERYPQIMPDFSF